MNALPVNHPLRRLFAGLTEHAFLSVMGVTDPKLIDYLSELLTRFIHSDSVHRLRNQEGQPIDDVSEMIREAESLPTLGRTRREYHRHIGDFTLFWIGIFPEAVRRKKSDWTRDSFISYVGLGKRSYQIASTFDEGAYQEEAPILRRLSSDFEICAYGLNQVRKEFDALQIEGEKTTRLIS
jgi:hypothetical protein